MTPKVLLTLVAVVLGADGSSIQIDKGFTDGLRPGDHGEVFYELTVGGEIKRLEVGSVEVLSVEDASAQVGLPAGKSVRPGFKVEFEIDPERLSPAIKVPEVVRPEVSPTRALPDDPVILGMLRIATGDYKIGLNSSAAGGARFYNESPRFERTLAGFWIDPAPAKPTGLDFAQTQAHCEARGGRLPTEFEWEVGAQHPSFKTLGRLEWTSSWYAAYPGNHHPEEAYGKRYRVLRGSTDADSFRVQERRYFELGDSSAKVGFRCAWSGAPD